MEGEDWSSFNGVFVNEEADFMAQLFPTNVSVTTNNVVAESSGLACWSNGLNMATGSIYPPSDSSKFNLFSNFSQESCYSGASCITNYHISDNNYNNSNNIHTFLEPNNNNSTLFEESGEVEHFMSPELDNKENDCPQVSRKHARSSDVPSKGKRNAGKSKKRQKANLVEEDNNGSSEDESHLSLELNNGVSSLAARNSNGKTRACRGSATDPQSLYARKRRERINERLRILQGLVPNGTKVDISTMLEEAVEYVKFLQLQIKLLSSDDLWMYAPIAYNGMDIGLDLKMNASK